MFLDPSVVAVGILRNIPTKPPRWGVRVSAFWVRDYLQKGNGGKGSVSKISFCVQVFGYGFSRSLLTRVIHIVNGLSTFSCVLDWHVDWMTYGIECLLVVSKELAIQGCGLNIDYRLILIRHGRSILCLMILELDADGIQLPHVLESHSGWAWIWGNEMIINELD